MYDSLGPYSKNRAENEPFTTHDNVVADFGYLRTNTRRAMVFVLHMPLARELQKLYMYVFETWAAKRLISNQA